MYHNVLDSILNKFEGYAGTTRAIILSPDSKHGDALIARLLNHPKYTALYYALSSEDSELSIFIDNMTRAFMDRDECFGRYTSLAHLQWRNSKQAFRDAALEGLIYDLSMTEGQSVLLIMDDFDHAEQVDDIQRFLEDLAARLPDNCLLVINGRTQPRFPWISLIAQSRALIFDDGEVVTQTFSPKTQDSFTDVEVYAIGPGFVYMNGEHISKWEGHLPRLLLFFAVDRGAITRDDFQRAFWDELEDIQATNVFHVTKRRLHRAFDIEILEHLNGTYRLRPGVSIYYDAFEWTQALVSARDPNNPTPEKDYERLIGLYRGPFLKGHDEAWIIARRQDILAGYIEAVLFLAERQAALFSNDSDKHYGALEKAYQMYLTALEESPNHPEVVLAAAELLLRPDVERRIEAHDLLNRYIVTKKKAKEPADPRIVALSKQLHGKK